MKAAELTKEQVETAIAYDPENGSFTWKINAGKSISAGSPAGTWKTLRIRSTGEVKSYLYITFLGRNMTATRVAWLLHYGEWPTRTVQFIDGNTLNLKISNLRLASFESKKVSVDGRKIHKLSKEASRHYGLKRLYGMTMTEYSEMLTAQNGKCAICENPETSMLHGKVRDLSVDHCHKTGKIRQLLCNACNHMLGASKENVETLLAAVEYLKKNSAKEEPTN